MMHKITYTDLTPISQQMQMTNFVRHFTPRSWWEHLMPAMVQLWAVILLRSAFGEVDAGLCRALGIYGPNMGGVGTWHRNATHVMYTWVEAGEIRQFVLPEWGPGVWREVTSAFQRFTSPHADWSRDKQAEDINALVAFLVTASRGCRVFEALGILGGTWSPAGGVAPSEKTLDNPNRKMYIH